MNNRELNELREEITSLIDDVKFQSDSLTDLKRLPVIQLKVLLAKMNKMVEKTSVLIHQVEERGRFADMVSESKASEEVVEVSEPTPNIENEVEEETIKEVEKSTDSSPSENVEEKLKKLVVNDLLSAIGINEKYLYSSVMFNNNLEEFTMVVTEINKLQTPDEATEYLRKLQEKYQWDLEDLTIQSFIELVDRKFDQP